MLLSDMIRVWLCVISEEIFWTVEAAFIVPSLKKKADILIQLIAFPHLCEAENGWFVV